MSDKYTQTLQFLEEYQKLIAEIKKPLTDAMKPITEFQKSISSLSSINALQSMPVIPMATTVRKIINNMNSPLQNITASATALEVLSKSISESHQTAAELVNTFQPVLETIKYMYPNPFMSLGETLKSIDFDAIINASVETSDSVTDEDTIDHLDVPQELADYISQLDESISFPEPDDNQMVHIDKSNHTNFLEILNAIIALITLIYAFYQGYSDTALAEQYHSETIQLLEEQHSEEMQMKEEHNAELMQEERKQTTELQKQTEQEELQSEYLKDIAQNTYPDSEATQQSNSSVTPPMQ